MRFFPRAACKLRQNDEKSRHAEVTHSFAYEVSRESSHSFSSRTSKEILPTCAGVVLPRRKNNLRRTLQNDADYDIFLAAFTSWLIRSAVKIKRKIDMKNTHL
ncbi:MAG: hypothetical protein K9N09_07340 [Candidatus Cloacimonetes bacterium]|nr:hypothetical protein [Candidatus Cloacimonadota bacterium]MCF7868495.1 hypothetical protein [Candidatus Cloacimonadota bacterium]